MQPQANYLLCLLLLTACSSTNVNTRPANPTSVSAADMPKHPMFHCDEGATLAQAAGRLAADGWSITYRDPTLLHTAPRLMTSQADQVSSLLARGGFERERVRLTVVQPDDDLVLRFRADVETYIHVPPAPPVRSEILLDNLVPSYQMSDRMRERLNALHLAVCGTANFFSAPRRLQPDLNAAQ